MNVTHRNRNESSSLPCLQPTSHRMMRIDRALFWSLNQGAMRPELTPMIISTMPIEEATR